VGYLTKNLPKPLVKTKKVMRVEGTKLSPHAVAANNTLAETQHARGLAAAQSGDYAQAADFIHQAVMLCPNTAHYHSNLGNVRQEQGRLDEAIAAHRQAIALAPNIAAYHHNLGNALRLHMRLEAAEACYRTAILHNPALAKAYASLGSVLTQSGRWQEAAAQFETVLQLQPEFPDIHANLGAVLLQLGRLEEAIVCLTQATTRNAHDAFTLCHLGHALARQGRGREAGECYSRALACAPNSAEAQNALGNNLRAYGVLDAAIACYRRAIELRPNFAEFYNNVGVALREQGAWGAAAQAYHQAIALKPKLFGAHANLGVLLQEQGALDEAIACHQRSIEANPEFAEGYHNLGISLQEKGALDAAWDAFERAIAISPRRGVFYRMLVGTGRMTAESAQSARLEALAAEMGTLPEPDRLELHFALGTFYADTGQPTKSSAHLLEANRLKRRQIRYDECQSLGIFDRIQTVFTREMLEARGDYGRASTVPIFIVGMPRSGTTLLEQILASHPTVHGAGELETLPRLLALHESRVGKPFPELVETLAKDELQSFADDYLESLHRLAPTAGHIVDKMPNNFLRIGLIKLAFPAARIIHVQRDPVDTCLSCFSKSFSGDLPYSYNLAELARYYRAYERLMIHWQQVLPGGSILNIRYEDLVADLEGQSRQVLAFCDIPWHQQCLQFHQNPRTVRTSSLTQVRQPLYTSSVGRWHSFPELVGPLLESLTDLGATTDSSPGRVQLKRDLQSDK